MPPLSVPTSLALPPSQRVPTEYIGIFRMLNKLSRASLLSLILDWLDDRNQALSAPHIAGDDENEDGQDLYPPAQSIDELREYYMELQTRKGSKREIVDRVMEGDWRDGLSLYQLAMIDMQYLYDHPASQRWTGLKVVQLSGEQEEVAPEHALPCIPRFHPPTFLQNLQKEVLPDIKAHYNIDRHASLPLLLLRIYVLDSPYNTSIAILNNKSTALDSSKTIYIAFPDASPHVFVSLATSTNPTMNTFHGTLSLRKLILDGIPKAFSKPGARYALQSTNLSARSLEAMVVRRGGGRTNAAGGGWGIYAENDKENIKNDTPLNNELPTPPRSENEKVDKDADTPLPVGFKRRRGVDTDEISVKRRKSIAQARFGNEGKYNDKKGIERVDIRLEDPFPAILSSATHDLVFSDDEAGGSALDPADPTKKLQGRRTSRIAELERDLNEEEQEGWIPDIRITFHGTHVFAGVRELVEAGVIDGIKMPGWMTGEEGVSVGVVKEGRIRGFKGSGI